MIVESSYIKMKNPFISKKIYFCKTCFAQSKTIEKEIDFIEVEQKELFEDYA